MNESNLMYQATTSSYEVNRELTNTIDEDTDLKIGLESNYGYDIIYNDVVICKEKKSYISDFIFNIEHKKNLGYTYQIKGEKSYHAICIRYYIYCDPDILHKRIQLNQIYEFENNLFKYIFQKTSPVQLIDKSWKDKSIDETIEISKQPKKLSVKLFEYQLKSLAWMKKIEDSNNTHLLDTKRCMTELINSPNEKFNDIYFDMFESSLYSTKVHTFNSLGGILADEMGLGKTITSISLILEKPYVYKPNNIDDSFNFETKIIKDYNYLVTKATLILCPSHLTKQWSHEIEQANRNMKQILVLTKTNHEKYTYEDILNADVVIISFQFLFNINYYTNYANIVDSSKYQRRTKSWLQSGRDVKNRINDIKELASIISEWNKTNIQSNNAIFESIFWHRVIIDEAHEMFTDSYQFENIYLQTVLKELQCHNKWYVSGTPFYNTKTLVNVMNFLEFNANVSYCDNSYQLDLDKSMKYGLSEGNILNSIFKQIYIRNTKESVKDQLTIPPVNIENILLEFSDFESTLYESLKNNNSNDYLRQICCNIQISDRFGSTSEILNFNEVREKLIKDNENKIKKTQLSIQNLDSTVPGYEARKKMLENIISSCQFILNCFNSEIKVSDDSCPICRCEFDDPVVTSCGHNFCYECINEVLNMSSYKKECPICRTAISSSQIFKLENQVQENKEQVDELVYQYGTKLAKLIKLCKQILLDKSSKIIIFSEWDRLLSMIGTILKNNEIHNVFCKGNVHQRNAAISAFRKSSKKKKKNSSRVIMLSTEHAASGTNLTDATHIIFMESHMGEYGIVKAMEDQAIGRAVRLGQENQVNVFRLIMKNTIEEDIFNKYLEGEDNINENQSETQNKKLDVDI